MGLVLATTTGLVVWLVLWSIGSKSIDGFMITALIVLVAGTLKLLAPGLPGRRHE